MATTSTSVVFTGGEWKYVNDSTISYVGTVGTKSTVLTKVAGLTNIKKADGGGVIVVDPTTGEETALSDDDIKITPEEVKNGDDVTTSYKGTVEVGPRIIDQSKLTLTNTKNYNFTLDFLEVESKVHIMTTNSGESSTEVGTYNPSKGTYIITANLTKGYVLAKDKKSATFAKMSIGAGVATVSGLAKNASASTIEFSDTAASDGVGTITLSKVAADVAALSDNEDAISALGTANIKVTTNANLAQNGTNYYLALGEENDGDYAQKTINDYAPTWTVKNTTATYRILSPAGYKLNKDDGTATQINYTAAKSTPIATVTGLIGGITTDSSDGAVGIISGLDKDSNDKLDDFLSGLTATVSTEPTLTETADGVSTKGDVSITINRNVLPIKKGNVEIKPNATYFNAPTINLDSDGNDSIPTAVSENQNIWIISGTTATLKKVNLVYYTLKDGNKIACTAQTNGTVLATIKNLDKDWLADENHLARAIAGNKNTPITAIAGIEFVVGSAAVKEGSNITKPAVPGTITIAKQLLAEKNVTIGNGDNFRLVLRDSDGDVSTGYGLESSIGLSAVTAPTFKNPKWNLSGTTATLKGTIKAGYTVSDNGKVITYTAAGNNQTLATIKNLRKNITLQVDGNDNRTIGYVNTSTGGFSYGIVSAIEDSDDSNNELSYYSDASDADTYRKLNKLDITLSKNVLGTGDAEITSNFFKLAIDQSDKTDEVHYVLGASGASAAVVGWHGALGTNATLKSTTPAYYSLNPLSTKITYNKPGTDDATTLAVVKGLNSNITEDDISFDKDTGAITLLSENAVNKKNITIENKSYSARDLSIAPKFYLGLSAGVAGLSAPTLENYDWTQSGNTVTFKAEVKEGYQVSSDSMAINYTAGSTKNKQGVIQPSTLATITNLKSNLDRISEGGTSIQFAGVSFNEDAGLITLSVSALNNAKVELKNSNYSLSIAEDVPTEAGSASMAWVLNGETAVFKKVDGNAYYELTNDKTLTYKGAGTVSGGINYVTINGLKSGLTVSEGGNSIGYYTAGGSFVTAVTINQSMSGTVMSGSISIVDEAALNNKNISINTGANATKGNFTIALGASLADAQAAKYQNGGTSGWWTFSKGTATYKGNVDAYYANSSDKVIKYNAKANGATIATIKGLKTSVSQFDSITGNVGSESGLVLEGNEITVYKDILGTTNATVTTSINIGGQSNYKFTLAENVMTYDDVSSDDDGVWVITSGTRDTSTSAERYVWTKTHYGLAGESGAEDVIEYHAEGKNGDALATITGLAKGLGTIKGGEIAGISVAGTDTDGKGLEKSGLITFTDNDVIIEGEKVVLANSASGVNYSLSIGLSSGVPVPVAAEVYAIDSGAKKVTIYDNLSAGYKVVNASESSTLTYSDKTNNTETVLAEISPLKSELKITANSGKRIDEIEGITVDRANNRVTLSLAALGTADVVTPGFVNAFENYSLSLADDVPAPLSEGAGWTKSTVKGSFILYDNCSASGYKLENNKITYSGNTGEPTGAVATISGLDQNLTINSYQIAGISVSTAAKTITLSNRVLAAKDVSLVGTGGYSLALISDSNADGYVVAPEETNEWAFSNGTATFTQSLTEGYKVSGTSSIKYTPTRTVTTTLTNLNKEKELRDIAAGISYADDVFTITDKEVLAHKQVKLTAKASKGSVDYTLALDPDNVAAPKEALTWNKTVSDNKATLTQVTKSGYTLSTDKKTINYSSDPTTATLATITGLKKAGVSAVEITSDDYATEITGIVVGNFSESTAGQNALSTGGSGVFEADPDGKYIMISSDVVDTLKIALGAKDGYKFVLDIDGTNSIATAADSVQAWTVNKTTATYKHVSTPFYTLATDAKSITYTGQKNATVDGKTDIVSIGGLKSGLVVQDGAISGITFGEGNNSTVITLTEDVLGTGTGTVTVSAGYSLALAAGVTTKNSSWSGVTEWVGSGNTYTYKTYDKGYYTLKDNKITYKAATKGTTYATITGLSAGLTDEDIRAVVTLNDSDAPAKGGTIALTDGLLDGKQVKLTGTNFSLDLSNDVDESEITTGNWTVNKTNATLTGTIGAGYRLSEDAKTVNYYSTDKKNQALAIVSGIKSGASFDTAESVEADGYTTITLNKNQLGTSKITIKGDYYKLDAKEGNGKSQVDDPEWLKNNNSTTATFTQTTYAGFAPTGDGKTLNYLSKTQNLNLITMTGVNKTLEAEDFKDMVTVSGASVILSADALTSSNVALGKNDPYTLHLADGDIAVTAYGDHFTWDSKGTASIVRTTTAGYEKTSDKVITYTKPQETLMAAISGLPKDKIKFDSSDDDPMKHTIKSITLGAGSTASISIVTFGASALGTGTITLSNKKPAVQLYKLAVDYTGSDKAASVVAGSNKWTYDSNKGTAILKSTKTGGYAVNDYNTSKNTQTITYTAESPNATLLTIGGIPKNSLEAGDSNTKLYIKGTETEAFTVDSDKKVKISDDFAASIEGTATAKTTITLNNEYKFANNHKPKASGNDKTDTNYASLESSGKIMVTESIGSYWDLGNDSVSATFNPSTITNLVTINGIKKTYNHSTANDDFNVNNSEHKVTVGAAALTNSNVTFSYPNKSATPYTFELGTNVDSSQNTNTESNWKNQVDWVTSGGTATYKLYNKANYKLENVRNATNQITYVAPTKGSAFAAISGLNKTTASITGSNVSSGVITLDSDDLTTSNVTLKITNVKTVSDSIVAASIEAGNTAAGSFKLTLANDVDKSTVENAYWDTDKTTAKLIGTIGKGYRLSTNKMSVAYFAADKTNQTIVTVSGLKKDAGIENEDVTQDSDDAFIQNITLDKNQLTTTKVALKGEGYKLKLDTSSTTSSVISADNTNAWQNQEGWFASNGTFTYKKHNKAYYTVNALGTEIAYTALKDVQQHAVIGGLNKTVTNDNVSEYATIASGVITLSDEALNKANVTFTDKDVGGYTLALSANSTVKSTVDSDSVAAVTSGTGTAARNATITGYQSEGYRLNNDAQTFTYFNATNAAKKQNIAVITGLANTVTNDSVKALYDADNNAVSLSADNLYTTTNKVGISGTAAFGFGSGVTSYTITGSKAADRVTVQGGSNIVATNDGNDYIVVGGAENSVNSGAGNNRILISSEKNSIVAGKGNDYINISSGTANSINSGAGIDHFIIATKSNSILAGDGNDTIEVTGASNTINAGKGNDYIDLGLNNTGTSTLFYANGDGADVIANFKANDTFKVTSYTKDQNKISFLADSGSDARVKVNTTTITFKDAANVAFKILDKNGEEVKTHPTPTPTPTSNVLADDNYSMTPQLSSIVKGSSGYMTEDLVATDATSLTKQSTAIAYGGKK